MKCNGFEHSFYGSVTIGERGQVVIPAEARQELEWQPGEKLLVMRHPAYKGIMLFKIEQVREFLDDFAEGLARAEAQHKQREEQGT